MAGSRYSYGVIRNRYPSLALLSFMLASFSGRLPNCGKRWPPADLGVPSASLAIPTERNYLSPKKFEQEDQDCLCLIWRWSKAHPRISYCSQRDVVFSWIGVEPPPQLRGSAISIQSIRLVSERCDFSKRKRGIMCAEEGHCIGQPPDGHYSILHSEFWEASINSFFPWSFFSTEFLSF